jgi:hypothetical protein
MGEGFRFLHHEKRAESREFPAATASCDLPTLILSMLLKQDQVSSHLARTPFMLVMRMQKARNNSSMMRVAP